jgi:hypothetical protein
MTTIRLAPEPTREARCPKCANQRGIRDGGPSLNGFRKYDVLSDTFGVCVCPACKHRGAWIDFHQPREANSGGVRT